MYIVTGGAGFIGSALVQALNERGIDDILIVDNLGKSDKWKNLQGKNFSDYLHKSQFLEHFLAGKFSAVKAILHMGACSSTTECDAEYMLQNNYVYTRHLAEQAVKRGIRFIYASSGATYGSGEFGYDDSEEIFSKLRALNVYGYSKILFDNWALKSGAIRSIAGLKFFNVYGPNEYHKADMRSVVLKSFEQVIESGSVNLFASDNPKFKDGEQMRDFIYVKDCCDIMCWLLETPSVNGVFNCGTGQARTWKALVESVFAAMQLKPKINYVQMPERLKGQYQYFTEAKMEKLRQAGYARKPTSLEDGVRDYIVHYLSRGYARL